MAEREVETIDLKRRNFCCGVIGLSTTALLVGEASGIFDEHPAERIIVDLYDKYPTAADVARSFVRAKSPELMVSYSVFYPEFFRRESLKDGRMAKIRTASNEEKKRYSLDHHRLDALPAVAAVHSLREAIDEDIREELCAEIALSLVDERREVREIVLQNLVTASAPNPDVISVDDQVLQEISPLLSQAESNSKLVSPLTLATTFLLNIDALGVASGQPSVQQERYRQILRQIAESKSPNFWYAKQLISAHKRCYNVDLSNTLSLPPQSSEVLIGSQWLFHHSRREYLETIALIYAKLLHTCLSTAEGRMPSDNAMTMEEARRALPKLVAFFRDFEIDVLLQPELVRATPDAPEDREFRSFVFGGRYEELIRNPRSEGLDLGDVQSPPEQIELARHVPFAKHHTQTTVEYMNENGYKGRNLIEMPSVGSLIEAILAGLGIGGASKWLLNHFFRCETDAREMVIDSSLRDEYISAAESRFDDLQKGRYAGVDEKQQNLGSIKTKRSPETRTAKH